MKAEKSRTAYGYTETAYGPVPHLKIVGISGVKDVVKAPVAIITARRDGKGLPFPEVINGMFVYILPGGLRMTADGKTIS